MSAALPHGRRVRLRRPTATASFGSSRRESHDASAFYQRFVAPELSDDDTVNRPSDVDVIHVADARDMAVVPSSSVALVVTSPPYFAGKEYEQSLGRNGVPASYLEYLELLRAVFSECMRVLEPGGRIAVNVANLGRRPYRSLAGDVGDILTDLGLLLRGEVVWWKGRAAGGSCAWGTFQRPANPVLRDVTERIVIASKGRFDRALTPEQRERRGLPHVPTITRDEFLEATTDLWELPPESATRVGHPAPFPVELPARLIELYTYEGDVVLDPFMGSGTTAVAAVRSGRHYVGFDTDPEYVRRAEERVAAERARLDQAGRAPLRLEASAGSATATRGRGPRTHRARPLVDEHARIERALRDGVQAKDLAGIVLETCGFMNLRPDAKLAGLGVDVSFLASDRRGGQWAFEVCGAFTSSPSGLQRTDALLKTLGKAAVWHEGQGDVPLVLLATSLPAKGSRSHAMLHALTGDGRPVFDIVGLLDDGERSRLVEYALQGRPR